MRTKSSRRKVRNIYFKRAGLSNIFYKVVRSAKGPLGMQISSDPVCAEKGEGSITRCYVGAGRDAAYPVPVPGGTLYYLAWKKRTGPVNTQSGIRIQIRPARIL